jgi:hypothetical protein
LGPGGREKGSGFPPESIPHLMRGGNDQWRRVSRYRHWATNSEVGVWERLQIEDCDRVYEEDQALLAEFWEFDRKMIHEKYKAVIEGLEKRRSVLNHQCRQRFKALLIRDVPR